MFDYTFINLPSAPHTRTIMELTNCELTECLSGGIEGLAPACGSEENPQEVYERLLIEKTRRELGL